MTNEEAIEILEFIDQQGHKEFSSACQIAIKAIKDQPKYKRALHMAIECINDCCECPAYVNCDGNANGGNCVTLIKSALKRINGIEDDAK